MFAFRAHAHALGKVITGYRYSKKVNLVPIVFFGF